MACASAKANGGAGNEVALVTNIELPEAYQQVLAQAEVEIIRYEFDKFNFGNDYRWSLAFYKLCAFWHVVHDTQYDNYAWLDSDVYIQLAFDDIWKECETNVLLYDICERNNEKGMRKEASLFTGTNPQQWTHFGGEFFASNRNNALTFIQRCEEVFEEIKQGNFTVRSGDEFITSVAAQTCDIRIHNAAAYIYRYWTRRFRLVSTNYRFDPVCILHVPAEKETGMIGLYRYYVHHNHMPKKHVVWRMLHLSHAPIVISLYWLLKDLFSNINMMSQR